MGKPKPYVHIDGAFEQTFLGTLVVGRVRLPINVTIVLAGFLGAVAGLLLWGVSALFGAGMTFALVPVWVVLGTLGFWLVLVVSYSLVGVGGMLFEQIAQENQRR